MSITKLRKRSLRSYRRIPKFWRLILRWFAFGSLAVIVDILLLYILGTLTANNLVDWKIVISFLVVEVLAAVIAKLLGVGEESEEAERYRSLRMAALKARLIPRFRHLETHYIRGGKELPYAEEKYYVVNTKTKKAYLIPEYILALDAEGAITSVEHQTEDQLKGYFSKNEITLVNRYPENDELNLA